MLSRIGKRWRALRRALSRGEWLARVLRLQVAEDGAHRTGLVMIQIDGLSHGEFQKALKRKEMPFLKRLIEREHFDLRPMYAGVPATTSAVQAELFYGVRQAVPGFCFLDRDTGHLATMIDSEMAKKVERELTEASDLPLLEGGSGYANNYSGGASEPHFCPTSRGWGRALREASPFAVAVLVLANIFSFLRTAALVCLEILIALGDLVSGVIQGKNFLQELKFVPSRIAITVLLRELAVIGAKIDIARGLPIVHINFLGYDEQAHRRGPESRFAHWTLKGIDAAIRRLWKATRLSDRRHYEVWVYSDHGQESPEPYPQIHGRTFGEAVSEVFSSYLGREVPYALGSPWGAQLYRAGHLGTRIWSRLVPDPDGGEEDEKPILSIAALGPVSMIYWSEVVDDAARSELARQLTEEAAVPAVLYVDSGEVVRGWMEGRAIRLPEDGEDVVGKDHPYRENAIEDLARLCRHKNAGEFVALGMNGERERTVTFALENGSHGGAGPSETSAFALVPGDTEFMPPPGETVRIRDLRKAALKLRGRISHQVFSAGSVRRSIPRSLRLVSYNVHSCIGMDGRLSPQRIARVIARCEPDIVCLQELDMHRPRSGGIDQAHQIAEALGMHFHFHPALHIEEERYGDAILTHLPMKVVKAGALPHWQDRPGTEPRGALWAEIKVNGALLQVINTHLGLRGRDRKRQVDSLLGASWLAHPDCRCPVVLAGDLNALPRSYVHRQLSRHLRDAQRALAGHRPRPTFSGHLPSARIDHVFIDSSLEVMAIEVPVSALSRLASDHLPLVAELRLP